MLIHDKCAAFEVIIEQQKKAIEGMEQIIFEYQQRLVIEFEKSDRLEVENLKLRSIVTRLIDQVHGQNPG